MKDWEIFEKKIYNQVSEIFKDYDYIVEEYGKADSTKPDIKISKKSGGHAFIETKMPKAQTSQFVVLQDKDKFYYSSDNRYPSNEFSNQIIEELNSNDKYKIVDQTQIIVDVSEEIASKWIISNFKNKAVDYVITEATEDETTSFRLEDFSLFFNIKTILRRKKSGSRKMIKSKLSDFKTSYNKVYGNEPEIIEKNKKFYLKLKNNTRTYLDGNLLPSGSKYYYYKSNDDNLCEIKITGSTNNPNIIFEISYKSGERSPLLYLIEWIVEKL